MTTLISRHQGTLASLSRYLGPTKVADLQRCARRLATVLHGMGGPAASTVLAMFGGGKDSSFMTAAGRYIQLYLEELFGETFLLRIATNRHAGMPAAVMENIHNVYLALDLYDDPRVELVLVQGNTVSEFRPGSRCPDSLRDSDRLDILMNGHRCQGDPRPTFCNRCNLSMENSVALAIAHGRHADIILTGDSPSEQKHYLAWVRRAARKLGNTASPGVPGFRTFLGDLDGIGRRLSEDVFGPGSTDVLARRMSVHAIDHDPIFFSIYEDTTYRAGDHWDLITGYLGFKFDEIAFSFTESDCGNPGLMAHLNGLRHERLLDSNYAAGVREYAVYAMDLMRRKEFPESLIATMAARYATSSGIDRMRRLMDAYAMDAFHLTEEQLVCMVYAPFSQGAKHLQQYLAAEKPELAVFESLIRRLLAGEINPAQVPQLSISLSLVSGLDQSHLQILFRSRIIPTRDLGAPADNPISIILRGDPHKAVIERTNANGVVVRELFSGR